jgi:hypothetical protein
MKKADVYDNNQTYLDRIIIENHNDLMEYIEKVLDGKYRDNAKEIFTRSSEDKTLVKNKDIVDNCIALQKYTGKGAIYHMAEIELKHKLALNKCINEGETLCMNEAGGYFTLSKTAKVVFKGVKIYTEADIKVSNYFLGKHYYAKIGGIDVEVGGEVKWNSYDFAYAMALKFLETIN